MQIAKILFIVMYLVCSSAIAQLHQELDKLYKLYQTGNAQQALTQISQLEKKHPDSNQLYHIKGRILYFFGRHQEAIIALQRSLQLGHEPKWVTGWNYVYLGMCYQNLDIDKAKKYLKLAMQLKATRNSVRKATNIWYQITGEKLSTNPMIGKKAADFALVDSNGRPISSANFRNKVLVLNIGSTW